MLELIALVATTGVTLLGYSRARHFVANRLRYVDAVHTRKAPIIAGLAAAAIATPLAIMIPLVGVGTALLFGAGVAFGVAAGARQARRRIAGS
jgi:hypothetical protein